MNELKRKAVEHHNAALVNGMDATEVIVNLRGDLLSLAERESIQEAFPTRRAKNRELISILFRTREELEPFEGFVDALKNTEKHEIMAAEILTTYTHGNIPTEFEKVSETSPTRAVGTEQYSQTKQPELSTMNADGRIKCYQLNTIPKGHMLIIANNTNSKNKPKAVDDGDQRDKTQKKLEKLGDLLGYDVKSSYNNITAKEMKVALKEFVTKIETEPHVDSAIIFIWSHGDAKRVFGSDGNAIKRQEFFDALRPDKCGNLTGKPKLIFIDACRGKKHDRGAVMKERSAEQQEMTDSDTDESYTSDERDAALDKREIDAANAYAEEQEKILETRGSAPPKPNQQPQLSHLSDMLIVDATAMNYVAYGYEEGSPFINAICEIFESNHRKRSIDEMLQLVHEHVLKELKGKKAKNGDYAVEGTNYTSSLRKKFKFCPTRDGY
uniref:Uncharacterized protein n=1 Tax=Plectus sambesii TaxID=2011161 RepID=A0A914UPK9_9BILA